MDTDDGAFADQGSKLLGWTGLILTPRETIVILFAAQVPETLETANEQVGSGAVELVVLLPTVHEFGQFANHGGEVAPATQLDGRWEPLSNPCPIAGIAQGRPA